MILEQIIKQANDTSKTLRIKGYRSSDGKISDFTIRLIGSDGYKELVRQSLEFIRTKYHAKTSAQVDAAAELDNSWSTTLKGGHGERNFANALVENPMGFFKSANDPNAIVLRNMECLSENVTFEPPPAPPSSRSRGSSEKTIAKRAIESQTPLSRYIGQLNLAPGKYDTVEVV